MSEPLKNAPAAAGNKAAANPGAAPVQKTIRELLNGEALQAEFARVLPKVCTVERFVRVALTALNKTPKLLDCSRESVLACFYKCAEMGLEPDGRRAHLIPYGNVCTMIVDYKGKVELAMRSNTVSNIHADKICDNDIFEFDRGEIKKHVIDFKKDRGKAYAYYCLVRFKDGSEKAEVMTMAEVDAIRKRSKASNNGPWVTDYDEMAKKTVFHRVSKWITLSPELRVSEEVDENEGAVTPTALPAAVALPLDISETAEVTEGDKKPEGSESLAGAAETSEKK